MQDIFTDSPVKHVVWDWNGTLFNDAWLCMDVMNELLRRHELPLLTLERYQQIFDFPVVEYYRRLGFDFERHTFEELGSAFIEGYEARRLECDLHDGALALLAALRDEGITQTVLSAYEHRTLVSLLTHFDIIDYFQEVIGIDDHYAGGKADKGRAWIARAQAAPSDILLIGDTLHDVEVAHVMGVRCVLVAGGNQHRDRLVETGVPLFDSLRELTDTWLATLQD